MLEVGSRKSICSRSADVKVGSWKVLWWKVRRSESEAQTHEATEQPEPPFPHRLLTQFQLLVVAGWDPVLMNYI